MRRKRHGGVVDLSCSGDLESSDLEDVQCSQLPYIDYDGYESLSETEFVVHVSSVYIFI